MIKISFPTVAAVRRGYLFIASVGTLTLTACTTSSTSPAPVQGPGKLHSVSGVRTYEYQDRMVVAGSARPTFPGSGNHVDVQLVGPGGRVVAEKIERIELGHPRGSRARHGSGSFVVSFPIESTRGATDVVVSLHRGSHLNCQAAQG